jgi:hypothetical protein
MKEGEKENDENKKNYDRHPVAPIDDCSAAHVRMRQSRTLRGAPRQRRICRVIHQKVFQASEEGFEARFKDSYESTAARALRLQIYY